MTSKPNSRIRTVLVVATVVGMAVAAVSFGGIAAVTIDTETTDTASTSDLTDGTAVHDLDNSSTVSTIEVQSDNASSGDDFNVYFTVNDTNSDQDGTTFYESGESWTATNESAGYYELNLTHATVFEDLERSAGENVSVDVKVVVNESETSEESVNFTITAVNDNDTAVAAVYGDEDGTQLTDTTSRFSLGSSLFGSDDDDEPGAVKSTESTGVNATNTSTIRVELVNGSAADAGAAAADRADSGEFLGFAGATAADQRVPVFVESADAEWLDTDEDAYATLDSEGDTLTVHNADTLVDEDGTVDVTTTANDAVGFGTTFSMLSNYDVSTTERIGLAGSALDTNGSPFESDD